MSEDLKALDGNALVARLAKVKERAEVEGEFCCNDRERAEMAAERADTEAVLDECAVRLLGASCSGCEDCKEHRLKATREVERLRELIRAVVAQGQPAFQARGWCWCGPIDSHAAECPWPALVAEAEKP